MNFESLVAQADILMPLLPLTASTRGLIDAKAIERLPRGALIINVARGSRSRLDRMAEDDARPLARKPLDDGRL